MEKILFVTSNLGIGGAQQHLILLANHLVEEGCRVQILNTNLNNDFLYRLDKRVQFRNIPRKYAFDLSPAKEIFEVAKTEEYKRVFCDSLFSFLYTRRICSLADTMVTVIFHTTNYVDNYNYLKDLFVRFLLRRNVKLLAVSRNQIKRLARVLFLKESDFHLIYNGIDGGKFNYGKRLEYRNSGLRSKLNISEDAFVIIKTARFAVEKNHELAIEVLELLRDKFGINAVMLFVGNTNTTRMNLIKEMAGRKGLGDHVILAGSQKDVVPFLAISDLFILTSKSVETFSIAALEAMAMGLPCVLTEIGGANEMVFPGKNGYLASYKDKETFAYSVSKVAGGELSLNNEQISELILDKFNIINTNKELTTFLAN